MVLGKLDMYKKMKLDHLLMPHTRRNSKWIKDLNVRPSTVKILEENIGSKILNIAHTIFFLIYLLRQWREKKKKIRLQQTKKVLHSKGKHQQNKRQPTEWGNIFCEISDKGLISKIYKELTKLNTKKQPS